MKKNHTKSFLCDKITKISFFNILNVFFFLFTFLLTRHITQPRGEFFRKKSQKRKIFSKDFCKKNLFFCTECIFARALTAIQKLTERARERAFRSEISFVCWCNEFFKIFLFISEPVHTERMFVHRDANFIFSFCLVVVCARLRNFMQFRRDDTSR